MPTSGQSVGVIGAGAWGTALATVAHRARCKTIIRAHEPEVVETINTQHVNPDYLPGIPLDPAISATEDYAEAAGADILLLATPAQFARAVREGVSPDGQPYYPAFAYPFYANFTDQEVADLWAAFQTVPPVAEASRPHRMKFPFDQRWGLKLWRAAFLERTRSPGTAPSTIHTLPSRRATPRPPAARESTTSSTRSSVFTISRIDRYIVGYGAGHPRYIAVSS